MRSADDPGRDVRAACCAARMADIAPFHVVEILARVKALEAQGRSTVSMIIGEPDFGTPEPVLRAAREAFSTRPGCTEATQHALRSVRARRYCRSEPRAGTCVDGAGYGR